VLEVVKDPLVYCLAMMVVFLSGVIPPSPTTLMAAKANPAWLLATLAALAGAITAVLDHYLVRRVFRVQALARVRRHRLFERAERWANVAPFFTVFLFAALPLPFAVPRILVPISGYPVHRYVPAVALGRWPRIFVIASFGKVVDVPSWLLEAAFVGGIVLAAVGALLRRAGWIGTSVTVGGPPPAPPAAAPPPAPPPPPSDGGPPTSSSSARRASPWPPCSWARPRRASSPSPARRWP
jgi:uncharacterized membrane protein YdjX (TVP38/TMEM64 family)